MSSVGHNVATEYLKSVVKLQFWMLLCALWSLTESLVIVLLISLVNMSLIIAVRYTA